MLEEIIERHTKNYFIKNISEDEALILLYQPYLPYKRLPDGYVRLDAYYIASNKLYHIEKNLVKDLSDYGAIRAKGNLKAMFQDAGCGITLNNTLLAIPPYGTRTALGAVKVKGNFAEKLPDYNYGNICETCGACSASCPSNALNEGFTKVKCLRYAMDHYKYSNANFELLDGGILGCDGCQSVCPYNKDMPETEAPEEIKELFKIDRLLKNTLAGRKALSELSAHIGSNYCKPERLAFFTLHAINRSEDAVFAKDFLDAGGVLSDTAKKIIERFKIE